MKNRIRPDYSQLSLRQTVLTLQQNIQPDGMPIGQIFDTFGSRSHAFLVLFLSVPFVQPVPMLGLSSPLGFIICILGLLIIANKSPWLPKRFKQKKISHDVMQSCCKWLARILLKTEHLIKPRYASWINYRITRVWDGFLIALFGFLLALPLPIPFSNMIPGIFLVLNAVGWLEKDGLTVIVSYAVALFGIGFFIGIGGGVWEAILLLEQKIQNPL